LAGVGRAVEAEGGVLLATTMVFDGGLGSVGFAGIAGADEEIGVVSDS
jgi:hypothetical protein